MEQIEAVYGGETENYYRFKINGREINLRIYIQKGKEIPEEIIIRLPKVKNRELRELSSVKPISEMDPLQNPSEMFSNNSEFPRALKLYKSSLVKRKGH